MAVRTDEPVVAEAAVHRRAPWWLGWLLIGGLVAVFAGERVLGGVAPARAVLSGVGGLVACVCVVLRALSWRTAGGEARRIEGWLLLAYAGCVVALVGYLVSSVDGMRLLGIDFTDPETSQRYRTALQVLSTMLLTVAVLPAMGAQLAMGAQRRVRGVGGRTEGIRVVEAATSGLVVALAGAFLFLLGYIVSERDKTLDLSYFKTATPGAATEGMVSNLEEPISVLLFFPPVNEVKDEVERYFRRLADASGRVRVEALDRLESPGLAERYDVRQDGTILFVRGERSQRLTMVGLTHAGARRQLRSLDREVQRSLYPLLRERMTAYLTTGHGELNDLLPSQPAPSNPLAEISSLEEILQLLNYNVRDLGLSSGLGRDVPPDAAFVAVLGPRRAFLEEELASLDRYLAGGGALLLALDPDSEFRMGPLQERIGVRYLAEPLADDQEYLRQRGGLSDRRLIITNRFSSHEAVTTLSRAGPGTGVLFMNSGHLERVQTAPVVPRFLVFSLASTFADLSGDYTFNSDETRDAYALVAAVEVPSTRSDTAPDSAGTLGVAEPDRPMRALMYASSSVFSDAVLANMRPNQALVADGVKWLGGDEAFAGATESEEDVPVLHTQGENVIWFYSTILGAPALLLAAGLTGVYSHRRRRVKA